MRICPRKRCSGKQFRKFSSEEKAKEDPVTDLHLHGLCIVMGVLGIETLWFSFRGGLVCDSVIQHDISSLAT